MDDSSGQGLFRFLKFFKKKRAHLTDSQDLAEEIHELMDEGQAKGLISGEETNMVYGALHLKETKAHSIMVPRTEISSASLDSSLGEIIKLVNECGHTRIPIHKDSIDKIVGILHAKDLLKLWGKDPDAKLPFEILRPPFFVPENQNISEVLKDLKEKKTHLAIVTDEYGGTSGIITIEDILEEIVGEILDEHDTEPPLLSQINENTYLVDAKLEIEKLEDVLNIELPKGDYESVGGFVINLLGRLPEVNEKIHYDGLEIIVQQADQRRVEKILVKINSPDNPNFSPEKPAT